MNKTGQVLSLSTEGVSKTFAGVQALADVSVTIGEGRIVGVIGPNGSGKTTLINVLSGVTAPSSGLVRLGDSTWDTCPAYEVARRGVTRTFQTIRLFAEMTVLENVEVAATCVKHRGLGGAQAASKEALARLDLTSHQDEIASTLPYGLQRRVEIARAIACTPKFLLLDEPAAGLNELESDELLETLLGLRRTEGFGMVLVDHDLRLIMRATDEIFVLNEGHVLAHGSPQEVRRNPEVIRAYIGGAEPADGTDEAELKS